MPDWKIQTYTMGSSEESLQAWRREGAKEQKAFWWAKTLAFVINASLMPTFGICPTRSACHVHSRGNPSI